MFYDRIWKGWPFNTDDCLIEVTTWAGLTVHNLVNLKTCDACGFIVKYTMNYISTTKLFCLRARVALPNNTYKPITNTAWVRKTGCTLDS